MPSLSKIMRSSLANRIRRALPDSLIRSAAAMRNRRFLAQGKSALAESDRPLIAFFSPCGMPEYVQVQAMLAKSLQSDGHDVAFVGCQASLPRCLYMNVAAAPPAAASYATSPPCVACGKATRQGLSRFALSALDLGALVPADERAAILKRTLEIDSLENLEHDGHRLQDLTLIDLALSYKQRRLESEDPAMNRLARAYTATSIIAYESVLRLARKRKLAAIAYNSEYTHHLAAGLAARKLGVPVINVGPLSHRHSDPGRSFMLNKLWEMAYFDAFQAWPLWRDLSLRPNLVKEIADDALFRVSGAGGASYSPPIETRREQTTRERLGVAAGRKLLVAFTSSVDEEISTKKALDVYGEAPPKFSQPYSSQIDWLDELAQHVEGRDDLHLVARIHPREGRNRLNSIESEHLLALRERFAGRTFEKVTIVWPEDAVSSYDLGEEADLVLISWSNIGMELSRFGVPVLASMIRISTVPHDDFIVRVPDKLAYYQRLDEMLCKPPSLATLARAYRWYAVTKFAISVDLQDYLEKLLAPGPAPADRPRHHSQIEGVIVRGESILNLNLEARKREIQADGASAENAESVELMAQMRRICHFFMTGIDEDRGDWTLARLRPDQSERDLPKGTRGLCILEGNLCKYFANGHLYEKHSALVARLSILVATDLARETHSDLERTP